ncbi:hypothetical protein SERLADRAFT_412339 [Serpula lacrymans var. lacrymans S7.9]|uniref:Uncharacterized protein n=1 Tax=Serpula lacrymans var. lacrymans (strain S7.9) TaxID=578457 RepID=F8NDU7_SERL9|nr:uncharacterized protein SERLADRAFT_412339 [Serpula lacrymans var. lacrymans S7.9]EGO30421.1 hypothetical protein SERLADRAFT_412339 [Serpula lacrymans var. lacrymans S7.9]
MSTHTAPITTSEDQVQPIIEQIDRNLKYNSQDVYVQQFYIEPSSFPEFVDKLRESDYSTLRYMYDHVKGILQLSMPTPVHGVFIERLSELLQGKLSGLIRWSDGMFKLSSNMFKFLWRGQITTVPDLALKFQCLNPSTKWQELLIFEFSHSQSVGDITQKVKKYWEELSHLVSILVVKFYESHKYAKPRYGCAKAARRRSSFHSEKEVGRLVRQKLGNKQILCFTTTYFQFGILPVQIEVLRLDNIFTNRFKEKMAHLPSMVDRTCPACGKLLKTPQGVMAHLSMKGKRRELEADNLGLEQVVYDEVNLDENVCNQEDYDLDGWALFSTELDWKFAHWALQEGVGQKSLDRLLVIPEALLPQGASVAPVIIVTDKTQLTQFSGNKSAYPVYLTLGYIPSSIRHKPSQHVFKDFSIPQYG